MGGGNSKKKAEEEARQKALLENEKKKQQELEAQRLEQEEKQKKKQQEIDQYIKPASPKLQNQKMNTVNLEFDNQIDKEARTKQQVEKYKNIDQIDNSFEKGMENLKLSDIQELERKIMEDDISPINKTQSITEEQKHQKDLEKIAKAALKFNSKFTKETLQFNWPIEGQVKIISVSYSYKYSPKLQMISLEKPYNIYVNSLMKWKQNLQNQVYEFTLKDIDFYDLSSGIITQLTLNEVDFMIDQFGNFVKNKKIFYECQIGLKSESDFIKRIKKSVQQQEEDEKKREQERQLLFKSQMSNLDRLAYERLQPKKGDQKLKMDANKIINETEKRLKLMWTSSVQNWLGVNKAENEHLVIGNTNLQEGQKCLLTTLSKEEKREDLELFLRKKLEQPQFYKICFDSNRTIKDTLKRWGAFSIEEELAYLHEERYLQQGNISFQKKFQFPILEKYEMTSGIISENDLKPLVITIDNCKQIVIENDRDLFVDIEHERKLMVFIWEEQLNQKIRSESIFVEELNKFRDDCDQHLKSILFELSMVPTFPMKSRTKYKDKYFQL